MLFNQTNNNGGDVNNAVASPSPASEGRVRIVRISNDFLCELLLFPPGTQIESCHTAELWRKHNPGLEIKISHPDFSPILEGYPITVITPSYREVHESRIEFVSWD